LFVNSTEDENRERVDPEVLAYEPDLTDERLYDFLGRYVRRVLSDDFIRRALKNQPQISFIDIIGSSDIAYVIAIIKNNGAVWEQDVRMKNMGAQAMGSKEQKKQPLFTKGEGRKREKGESLWNKEGINFFSDAEQTWKEIYNNEEQMKVVYNTWEKWIATKGKGIKIGDGSRKNFHYVMGTWYAKTTEASTIDSEDEEEEDSGYASDRGRTRASLGWTKGTLRVKNVVGETEGGDGTDSEIKESDGKRKAIPVPLLFPSKAVGGRNDNSSPARNTRKRTAAESPLKDKRSKRK